MSQDPATAVMLTDREIRILIRAEAKALAFASAFFAADPWTPDDIKASGARLGKYLSALKVVDAAERD